MHTQTYIEFMTGGRFLSEFIERKVACREEPPRDVPRNAIAYRYFDLVTYETTREDGKRGETNERQNEAEWTYYGTVHTIGEIKRRVYEGDRSLEILLSNMDSNGWDTVVKTRLGGYRPLEKGERAVPQ